MKIVFTGSGTGGHFYPLIAVAEEIHAIAREKNTEAPRLYFIGPEPYDEKALEENNIEFRRVPAGKMRRYFSFLNIIDMFKIIIGVFGSLYQLFRIYPDVVFSKGGYASFPTVIAAWILWIPVVVHESDAKPGRVNGITGKFARKIAIAYPEAAEYFKKKERIVLTGNPIRRDILSGGETGTFGGITADIPTLLIIGGSQGAQRINNTVLDALPRLIERYQIIHQTGKNNFEEIKRTSAFILEKNAHRDRYHVHDFLSAAEMHAAARLAELIISRAGSQSIFEIAAWGIPAILIPLPEDISHDQRKNAYAYARAGAAVVMEEKNVSDDLLLSEIERLHGNKEERGAMARAAQAFAKPAAGRTLAEILLDIVSSHR